MLEIMILKDFSDIWLMSMELKLYSVPMVLEMDSVFSIKVKLNVSPQQMMPAKEGIIELSKAIMLRFRIL